MRLFLKNNYYLWLLKNNKSWLLTLNYNIYLVLIFIISVWKIDSILQAAIRKQALDNDSSIQLN